MLKCSGYRIQAKAMYIVYGGEAYTAFRWENLKERTHSKDPGIDGRIILSVVRLMDIVAV
jgi:hypothetical protein